MALKFPQLHVVENNKKSLGIYVHIPFCRSKCEYCDFYSLPGARDKDRCFSKICSGVKNKRQPLPATTSAWVCSAVVSNVRTALSEMASSWSKNKMYSPCAFESPVSLAA